jgi:hypothetical protein
MARMFFLMIHKQDQRAAQDAISKALELNPGNAEILMEYARIRCYHGYADEAIAGWAESTRPKAIFQTSAQMKNRISPPFSEPIRDDSRYVDMINRLRFEPPEG